MVRSTFTGSKAPPRNQLRLTRSPTSKLAARLRPAGRSSMPCEEVAYSEGSAYRH
jgi:hypothetical protein